MDVLALHEAGIKNAISVPNGATLNSNNLDYLDNCIDYLEDKTKIILAVDADEAGQALRQEFIRRLGAEVCYLVDFNGCKDANEYLLNFGVKKLNKVIDLAVQVPLEGVSTLKDVEEDLKDFVVNGFKPGMKQVRLYVKSLYVGLGQRFAILLTSMDVRMLTNIC